MRRIGIMGGTFDPIHNAHLALGRQALAQFELDEIWFMPDRTPPHKSGTVTPAADRCRMTELAVAEEPRFVCSLFEQQREGFTYTSDTLAALRAAWPNDRFYFMLGADSLYEIESWHEPERVLRLAVLLVAARSYDRAAERECAAVRKEEDRRGASLTEGGGTAALPEALEEQIAHLKARYDADIRVLYAPQMDISSTQIRELVAHGKDIGAYVPRAVEAYIRERGLYLRREIHARVIMEEASR